MAKLSGEWWSGRKPAFRGRFLVYVARGVRCIRAWPRKRGPPTNPITLWWNDWFAQANYLAKYASSYDITRAKELTEGTKLYPRDIILSAMRGRLFWWVDEDGNKWLPYMAKIDISESLDVLAKTVGDVMVRGLSLWGAPPPGDEGDRLTYHPDAPPTWAPVGGGGGGFAGGALVTRTGNQSIPRLTFQTMAWQAEAYDTDGLFTDPPSNSRFTIPSGFTWCRLSCGIRWATSTTGYRKVLFIKNGAAAAGSAVVTNIPTGYGTMQTLVGPILPCVAGDYFEAQVYHNHSSALNVLPNSNGTWFSIQLF